MTILEQTVTIVLRSLALALVLVGITGAGAAGAYMMGNGFAMGDGGWGHMANGERGACPLDGEGGSGCDVDDREDCPSYGDCEYPDGTEGSSGDCDGQPRGCGGTNGGSGCW